MDNGRLIFMLRPDVATRRALVESFTATGLPTRLGEHLFPYENWHQSLAPQHFDDSDAEVERFCRIGSRVEADAFSLLFDHVIGRYEWQPIHWALRCRRLAPELSALVHAIQTACMAEGINKPGHPRAHITVSYRAPEPLPFTPIHPVEWRVEQFALVRGGGDPYRYETIRRWPLRQVRSSGATQAPKPQLKLF